MSSTATGTIKSCLDVLRRTDPRDAEMHLGSLAALISDDDLADELYQRVDVPLKVGEDPQADGRKFVLCEHNRDGDSHRSPWSNSYLPPLDDGFRPSERLRSLEMQANEVFDVYRELYYGKGTSVGSVYLWDKDGGEGKRRGESSGFAGCFLIRNKVDEGNYWNSIHVVDVGRARKGRCTYNLTTTLLISITPPGRREGTDSTNVSGSLVRSNARECEFPPSPIMSCGDDDDSGHIINIGRFIEEVESEMRSEVDSLYIQKTKTVVEEMRNDSSGGPTQGQEHTRVLNEAVLAMALERKEDMGADDEE
eukprot:CAMPEP_0172534774 /NCGR_PEP_ID=MMETSP1067-20121228/7021_1 /TAXON_ID=265564 ORGANISM="Thalassiosira punctigera, Strain Tpunct2005C2" /NCGR_SAMPLE_ID=MMETSP1067 /ASSEMBLY_ACC=CAM_ASM_000444 /LENGTH=307 /DNA_ID=CAMNT_0013319607 /DNA_START=18 /DNA_END=942 /DNA_ORIENTATION=-